MALTFGGLANLISAETNRTGTVYIDFIKNSILSAIVFMEAEYPYLFEKVATLTITQGNNAVNLPDDWSVPVYVSYELDGSIYGSPQGFSPLTYEDLIRLYTSTNNVGRPSKYAFFAGQFFVFPYTSGDVTFTLSYNYKDASYPQIDSDSSIWFSPLTIDCVKAKATELFYAYPLQTPEKAVAYKASFDDFINNLRTRNNIERQSNTLSI